MGLILNGNAPNKILYNGAEVSLYFNGSKIWPAGTPGFNEVTIGTQTWMAKNLAIDDGQGGIYTQTVNYGQGNVVEYYYTWDAAVRVAASISGWHLPSQNEWTILITAAGGTSNAGTKIKSTYGWESGNGTDDFGFAAFPAGYKSNYFRVFGTQAYFWTSTEYNLDDRYSYRSECSSDATKMITDYYDKTHCYSVRLIKDS